MKILVITQYFFPEQFRINDICRSLSERGHKITVVTGLPNYPEGEIYGGYEDEWKEVSDYYSAKVYRCKLRPRHKGAKNLFLNYISFVVGAKKVLKRLTPDFDVVYVYGLSPVSISIPVINYAKKHKIPICHYTLDIWPESVRDFGGSRHIMNKKHPVYIVSKWISKYVYTNMDIILNKCDAFSDYLHDMFKIPRDKMSVLYEHAEESYLAVNKDPIDNGIVDFMFLGNIGKAQNCDQIIEAFSRIESKNKHVLHFVGDGSELSNIKRLAEEKGIGDKVIFHGYHSIKEVNKFYELADACLLTLSNKTAIGLTPPAKLVGYMAACRPIIASIDGSAKKIINEANCGYVCAADDVDGLAKILDDIVAKRLNLQELGEKGRNYFIDNFMLSKHIDKLEYVLNNL